MTLLITVLTKEAIYQSADFRLTDLDSGGGQTDSSTKLIALQYSGWHGFISYTGIGKWDGKHTSEYVIDWLAGQDNLTAQEIVDQIRDRGTDWLKRIETKWKRPRHTFVLAAFSDAAPFISVISNFQGCFGKTYPATASLTASTATLGDRPLVVVSGAAAAVSKAMRVEMRTILRVAPTDSARIRRMLSRVNAQASHTHASRRTISPSCATSSFRKDGKGFMDIDGNVDMHSMVHGMRLPDVRKLFAEKGLELGKIVGATFASSAEPVAFADCKPQVIAPQGLDAYSLWEITHPELTSLRCADVSDTGWILGEGTTEGYSRLWKSAVNTIPVVSPFVARAGAINDRGEIAATARTSDGFDRAIKWTDREIIRLGLYKGKDSGVVAINSAGLAAGWVCIDASDRSQLNHRPCAGRENMRVLEIFGFDWGQVTDVNDHGQALIVAYRGWTCHALVWNVDANSVVAIGGRQGIFPCCINSSGLILGTMSNEEGNSVAYVTQPRGEWDRLGTPPGYYATAMNDVGDVVGAFKSGGYEKPWLRRASGEIVWLPYFREHWCRPSAINIAGLIVGTAQTDHGTHALAWLPNS